MRENLVTIAAIVIVAGFVWTSRDILKPIAGVPSSTEAVSSQKYTKKTSRPSRKIIDESQGGINEHVEESSFLDMDEVAPTGEDEPASGTYHQGESLPSIYDDVADVESEIPSSDVQTVVYGVPIESWILSQRHAILYDPVEDPTGLRVILGCMELEKENLKPLERKECEGILAHRPFEGRTKYELNRIE